VNTRKLISIKSHCLLIAVNFDTQKRNEPHQEKKKEKGGQILHAHSQIYQQTNYQDRNRDGIGEERYASYYVHAKRTKMTEFFYTWESSQRRHTSH
jgi:hypothetical protein